MLYQNLLNASNYRSVINSQRLFLFKQNENKNHKGTLTPKCLSLPDSRVARLSISIQYQNAFREGYDDKLHIKIFGIYPTIDL